MENTLLRIAILKENFDFRNYFPKFKSRELSRTLTTWQVEDWSFEKIESWGLVGLKNFVGMPFYAELLDALDPEISALPDPQISKFFPLLFARSAPVLPLYFDARATRTAPYKLVLAASPVTLEAHERAIVINVADSSFDDILDSFKNWLRKEKRSLSRQRSETHRHLAIWKMRRQRIPYSQIASLQKISIDAVKKSFRRAWALTQGRSYDPESFARAVNLGVTRQCDTCTDRPTCRELCPDMAKQLAAIEGKSREKYLSQDNDDKKDFLFMQNSL